MSYGAALSPLPAIPSAPQTLGVRVAGELVICVPASELPLAQRYMLR